MALKHPLMKQKGKNNFKNLETHILHRSSFTISIIRIKILFDIKWLPLYDVSPIHSVSFFR